jgi:serine phosphatase RsbU (regulator of sigma subunit)
VTFESVHRKKDGSSFPVEIRMSLLELDGQFILALARDVTDRVKRQQAEQDLRARHEQFLIAREIQQQLFPAHSPHVPGYDISGASYPADETGGDYYDFLTMSDGHIGIVIGDVGGHGVGPAILVGESMPLGIDKDAKFTCSRSHLLQPNDLVLMCTDGINETASPCGEQFGDKRLLDVVQQNRDRSAREIIEALYQSVRQFAGNEPQHDDITMVITKVLP